MELRESRRWFRQFGLFSRCEIPAQRIQEELDWLEANRRKVQSLASLALTKIGLDASGRSDPNLENSLAASFRDNDTSILNVPAIAWTTLAMSNKRNWLKLTMPGETS